jgi:hypothetical protein
VGGKRKGAEATTPVTGDVISEVVDATPAEEYALAVYEGRSDETPGGSARVRDLRRGHCCGKRGLGDLEVGFSA